MAAAASSGVAISTKAKPRDRPVSRSSITEADSTVPTAAKASRSSSLVVRNERFPTYSLVAILTILNFEGKRGLLESLIQFGGDDPILSASCDEPDALTKNLESGF